MTRVIILAGGDNTRWGNFRGVPKHLIPFDGVPLLHRTARQFKAAGADVVILGPKTHDPRYEVHGCVTVASPRQPGLYEVGMYLDARPWWLTTDRTILAYGDTYYTDDAVATIMGFTPREWHLFARFGPSQVTGKWWGEAWAHQFYPDSHIEEITLIHHVVRLADQKLIPRALIYEMYQTRQGGLFPWSETQRDLGAYTEINDFTEDLDTPDDLLRWEKNFNTMVTA